MSYHLGHLGRSGRIRTWAAAAVALLTVVLTTATQPAVAAEGRPYTNPVKAQKGSDPWIQYHDGDYYMITTSWSTELTMRKSPTLGGLSSAPSVRVWTDSTASRCCNMWAPELHFRNGRWYLSYTAGQGVSDYGPTQRLHVLESAGSDPMGPYGYKSRLGADVRQWTCNGADAQKWRIEDRGDDTSRLVNAASGKVLDTADCSTADGADVRQWAWLDNTCQQWRLSPV